MPSRLEVLIIMSVLRVFLVFVFLLSAPAFSHAADKPFHRLSPAEVDVYLRSLRPAPSFAGKVAKISFARRGTPYVLGCLGEEREPDSDPVFRTDSADCTVFVLTTLALAAGGSYDGAGSWMEKLNYYTPPLEGLRRVSYENRIHFTYDRLHSSPYFRDITAQCATGLPLKQAQLVLNRKETGEKLLPVPWEKKIRAYYIPCSAVGPKLLEKLPSQALGVGFVREKNFPLGVLIAHEGFIIDRKYFVHADSLSKKVVAVDFLQYLKKNSDYFDGIILSEFVGLDG